MVDALIDHHTAGAAAAFVRHRKQAVASREVDGALDRFHVIDSLVQHHTTGVGRSLLRGQALASPAVPAGVSAPRRRVRAVRAALVAARKPSRTSTRPGTSRRLPTVARVVALVLTNAALVGLVCYVVWALWAGERLVLGAEPVTPASDSLTDDTRRDDSLLAGSLVDDGVVQQPDGSAGTGERVETGRAEPSGGASSAVPSSEGDPGADQGAGGVSDQSAAGGHGSQTSLSVDGTAVAAGVSLLTIAAGAVVQAKVLRALRQRRSKELEHREAPAAELTDTADLEVGVVGEADQADQAEEPGLDELTPAVDPGGQQQEGCDRDPVPLVALPGADAGDTVRSTDRAATAGVLPLRPVDQALPVRPTGERVVLYDRRASQRLELQGTARLQWEGQDRTCRAQSLDAQGMRCVLPVVPTSVPPPVGVLARVTTIVDGALLALDATVAWARTDGAECRVGLRFDDLDEARQERLLTFLESAAAARETQGHRPKVSAAVGPTSRIPVPPREA